MPRTVPFPITITERVIERFWGRVDTSDANGCWTWQGSFATDGYPYMYVGRRRFYAHRLSWAIKNARDPGAGYVCHQCDNPRCVRPDHLWLGDAKSNMVDKCQKGRAWGQSNTACLHGHPFEGDSYRYYRGRRVCRVCVRKNVAKYQAKKKASVA